MGFLFLETCSIYSWNRIVFFWNYYTYILISPPLVQQERRIMNIFKKKVSAKEVLPTSKREMDVATRNIERTIASLQLEENKLAAEIKKAAQPGNEAATRILARQLVRLRQQITNLQGTRAQIRGVASHTKAMYATTSISTGMKGAYKAMAAIYKLMEPYKQLKIIKVFQKRSIQLDTTIEMISETIDETLNEDNIEEEVEFKVLDEIGVLSSASKGRKAASNKKAETVTTPSPWNVDPPSTVGPESSSEIDDLKKSLASLRQVCYK